jgi:FAD/FMN-containing dehydrogenase
MTYEDVKKDLAKIFKGEIVDDDAALSADSKDASLFVVRPKLIVYPKDSEDIKALVRYVHEKKTAMPELSVTARAAGTDMSGGPLNDSIIADVTKHMSGIVKFEGDEVVVLPGTFYRDFEKETLKRGMILPSYTASKDLNTVGGMVANNSAGEKTLRYGKTENYVRELKVVMSDGNEYVIRTLSKKELDIKMTQRNFEGRMYREIFDVVEKNKMALAQAKPIVSKNSAGYYLWNVWDGTTFDLTKLIVGSQGTLGIVTEVRFKLVPTEKISKLFVVFMRDIARLGEIVNVILKYKPESLESYDDSTLKFAFKYFPEMLRSMKGATALKLMWSFLPELGMVLRGGLPKLVLLVEFSGNDIADIDEKETALEEELRRFHFPMRRAKNDFDSEKYWTIRRESFNLLRKHVRGRRTAPFIDDVIVPPQYLPEFLPKMRKILDDYGLLYTIAGHAGNGNFHIIPLMDMRDEKNMKAIDEVSDKVYDLVLSYHGSTTAEHNDGIIRTPYLAKMFGLEIVALFAKTKNIFDPENIFNPGKKVPSALEAGGGTKAYMMRHISSA